MRVRSDRLRLLLACALGAVALCLPVSLLGAEPGMIVPLAATALVLAVAALLLATAVIGQPAGRAVVAWRRATRAPRAPARQCDPDAAGHVRSRAPGALRVLFTR